MKASVVYTKVGPLQPSVRRLRMHWSSVFTMKPCVFCRGNKCAYDAYSVLIHLIDIYWLQQFLLYCTSTGSTGRRLTAWSTVLLSVSCQFVLIVWFSLNHRRTVVFRRGSAMMDVTVETSTPCLFFKSVTIYLSNVRTWSWRVQYVLHTQRVLAIRTELTCTVAHMNSRRMRLHTIQRPDRGRVQFRLRVRKRFEVHPFSF